MAMNLQFQRIKWLCSVAKTNNIHKRVCKLAEETGECAQAIIKDKPISEQREEAVDVVIAALAVFDMLGGSEDEFMTRYCAKLNKWERKEKERLEGSRAAS